MKQSSLFLEGMKVPLTGLKILLSRPRLAIWSGVPFALTSCFLFLVLYLIFKINLLGFVFNFFGFAADEHHGFKYLFFYILIHAVAFFVICFFSYIFLVLISSPFLSLLSEKTLLLRQNKISKNIKERKFSLLFFISQIKISLLKSLSYFLLGIFVIFPLSFVPVVNILTFFLLALMLSFDAFDYALELNGLTLVERWKFFVQNFKMFIGLSITTFLINIIPFGILIIFPVYVVGAANLYSKEWGEI